MNVPLGVFAFARSLEHYNQLRGLKSERDYR